jgi:hypothetical protein
MNMEFGVVVTPDRAVFEFDLHYGTGDLTHQAETAFVSDRPGLPSPRGARTPDPWGCGRHPSARPVNIRKVRCRLTRPADLVRLGTVTPPLASFLAAAVVSGLNIEAVGGTSLKRLADKSPVQLELGRDFRLGTTRGGVDPSGVVAGLPTVRI